MAVPPPPSVWEETARFQYSPLAGAHEEIRLLDIQPSDQWIPGLDPGALPIPACLIRTVSLAHGMKPEYETVSYCWGETAPYKPITINNLLALAPPNAVDVIRLLALPDCARTWWLDALCINQLDPGERFQQVSLMAKIYRNGIRNVIFLGQGNDDMTRRALCTG
jgi:hypothetical protein